MLFEATGPGPLGLKTLPPPPDDDEDEATMCCCCCEAGGVASMLPGVPVFRATLLHDGAGFRISEVSALLVSSLGRKRGSKKVKNPIEQVTLCQRLQSTHIESVGCMETCMTTDCVCLCVSVSVFVSLQPT